MIGIRKPALALGLCVLFWSALPLFTLQAQDAPIKGSRRVATNNWSYQFIELLRERGYLSNLNPLVQPYRAQEVARGLVALDADTLPEPVAGWVRLLRNEYWREVRLMEGETGPRWGVMAAAGARASTSGRLDVLRPAGTDGDIWPWYNLGGWLEAGPVVGEMRLLGDTYLTDDPDGLDPGQRRGGRTDHAYVAADFPVASVLVGRIKNNWSRVGTSGLLASDVATAYPQLGFELRAWRFTLRSFNGELETFDGLKRYLAAHRFDYVTDNFVVSFGESILYASATGFQLRWLNPLEFLFFDHDNQPNDATQNLMLNLEFWYQTGGLTLYGEGLLDDIDIDPEGAEAEPPVYGFTLGSNLTSIAPWLGLGLEYQQVSAWAYRTPNINDQYSFLQRGLGENFSDYDQLTLRADLFPPLQGLRVAPVLQLQRQGEGDFRDSIIGGYQGEPAIFLGTVETTYRLGLRGWYQPIRHFWIGFDMGYNWVRNKDHVDGSNVSEFEAVAQIGATIDFPLRKGR